MIDLNELQFFVQVCRLQSFTLAARKLDVPKSSVSRAISRLEARLGVRLVERTTRSVTLTEAGEIYLGRCERMLEEAQQADLMIGAMHAAPRGTLRLVVPAIIARTVIGPMLGEFLALHPELNVHLQFLGTEAPLSGKNFDLMIRAGPLEDSGLLMKSLMRIRLGLYASPRYLAEHELPVLPADLRQHQCITTSCSASGEPGESSVWKLRRGSELQEVRVTARVCVPDPTVHHQLALAGSGVALLSEMRVTRDVAEGRLIRILGEWEPEPVELYALYPSQLNSSPKVRAFLQYLRKQVGERERSFAGRVKRAAGARSVAAPADR
ncbi:MAG: Transcriptional regulator, LysR family [Akkermansiaceae bacterium]|nr:Transcriptional regulator, LysR family [Akkermansiaceae bacterium]